MTVRHSGEEVPRIEPMARWRCRPRVLGEVSLLLFAATVVLVVVEPF